MSPYEAPAKKGKGDSENIIFASSRPCSGRARVEGGRWPNAVKPVLIPRRRRHPPTPNHRHNYLRTY